MHVPSETNANSPDETEINFCVWEREYVLKYKYIKNILHLGDHCNSKNTSVHFLSISNILDHRQWSDIMFFNLQSLSSPSSSSATLLPPLLSPPTQKQIHCLSFYVSILLHHFLRRFNAVPSANRLFSARSSGNYLYAYFFDAPDRMRRHQNENWNNLSDICWHRLSEWQLCNHIQIVRPYRSVFLVVTKMQNIKQSTFNTSVRCWIIFVITFVPLLYWKNTVGTKLNETFWA